ncbi:hypothetical protein GGD68_007067 [Paraburkholderia fungorum]|jgi:hypothetical protein|uniref:nuclease-related domain-containing protein n=1 Tax=Paraburkholderia fungorum TaxID=134537 RepID=UPI001614394F|nr:nuclease-related domain-containing protein [Paraburkholderia fungorum]MBB4518261.1 hypothetical protein [Paraburkholderia fungorum]
MSIWLSVIVTTAIFYAAKHRKTRTGATAKHRPTLTTRSQQRGEEGETAVQAELLSALQWLCGEDFYLHPGALLLNHAPGSDFPTAEVDHLAVTPFGIFIVETKNWSGRIEAGPTDRTIVRVAADGIRDERRSPLQQNRSKVAFLRAMLPGSWPVEGIAVFPHPHCEISSALPLSLMHASDLRQWLRARKSRHAVQGCPLVDVQHGQRAIHAISETGPEAIESHRRKARENPKKLPAFS